jgi:hypothetical protein
MHLVVDSRFHGNDNSPNDYITGQVLNVGGEVLFSEQRDEADGDGRTTGYVAVGILCDEQKVLDGENAADWDDHFSAWGQLLKQVGWDVVWGGGNNNRVKRPGLWPAVVTISNPEIDSLIAE